MAARKRHDPPFRSEEGQYSTKMLNADPNRDYVFLNPNDTTQVDDYEGRGYEVEHAQEGGPSMANRRPQKEGVIKFHGLVLYSRPKELRDAEFKEGQSYADDSERQIKGGTLSSEARGAFKSVENVQYQER